MKTLSIFAAVFALAACAGQPTTTSNLADEETYDADFEEAPLFTCDGRYASAKVFPTYSRNDNEHELLVQIDWDRYETETTVDAKYNFSIRYGGTLDISDDVQLEIRANWDNDTFDLTGFSGEIRNERTNRSTDLECESTKFEIQSYVRDRALNSWLKVAKEASDNEVYGNFAMADAYRLNAVPRTERFEQTIKQLLFGDWDEGVSVERQDNSYSTVDDAIDMITDTETGWPDHINPAELRGEMNRKLKAAIYHRDHMKVFTGVIDSDFCWDVNFVAVIDTRNDQLVVFGEGACE